MLKVFYNLIILRDENLNNSSMCFLLNGVVMMYAMMDKVWRIYMGYIVWVMRYSLNNDWYIDIGMSWVLLELETNL